MDPYSDEAVAEFPKPAGGSEDDDEEGVEEVTLDEDDLDEDSMGPDASNAAPGINESTFNDVSNYFDSVMAPCYRPLLNRTTTKS